jgi:hypothetical protein
MKCISYLVGAAGWSVNGLLFHRGVRVADGEAFLQILAEEGGDTAPGFVLARVDEFVGHEDAVVGELVPEEYAISEARGQRSEGLTMPVASAAARRMGCSGHRDPCDNQQTDALGMRDTICRASES